MKLAIVGSREYPNLKQVRDFVATLPKDTIVVSGGAKGVDNEAERAAVSNGLKTMIYFPDWSLGKKAGPLRNTDIVNACDHLVAFHDGDSRGTQDSINKAKESGKLAAVIGPEDPVPLVQYV